MSLPPCIRCGRASTSRCGKCKAVNYCGADCAKSHWRSGHKGECDLLASAATPVPQLSTHAESASSVLSNNGVKHQDQLFPPRRAMQLMLFEDEQHSKAGGGLVNLGNTCFLSSVLQVMCHTRPLITHAHSADSHSKNCPRNSRAVSGSQQFCAFCALEEQIRTAPQYEYFTPLPFLRNLRSLLDQFVLGRQEDAHELFVALLNALQTAYLEQYQHQHQHQLTGKLDFARQETSLVYQLFGGVLQSRLRCTQCDSVSTKFESYLDLSLDLALGNSLEEALHNFTAIETLDKNAVGWRCEKCAAAVTAQKQLTLYAVPNLLCIHLKRFDFQRAGLKLNKEVVFRDELSLRRCLSVPCSENISECGSEYELYAVICHFGPTAFRGHYVAFVRVEDTWLLYDDQKVQAVPLSLILRQNAYMLFYRRIFNNISGNRQKRFITGRRGLNLVEAKEVEISDASLPSSSAPSSASSSSSAASSAALTQTTPPYRVYYRQATDSSGEVRDVVLTLAVKLSTAEQQGLRLNAAEGVVRFETVRSYLQLRVPFVFQTAAKCSALYFAAVSRLVAVLPLQHDSASSHPEWQSVPVVNVASGDWSELSTLDPDKELSVPNEPRAETTAKELTVRREKPDSNAEVSTLGRLYADLKLQQQQQAHASGLELIAAASHVPQQKIGRNDLCPCGSRKKYKNCHGIQK